jgi:pimeloyl-ACP methyl ester carboxylesterase
MDGVPDIAEGENGQIEECDSEDDLIPIWIGGNYCGATHQWSIGVHYVWFTYDENESCTYAAFAGRVWYQLEGNGEYDPLWANAAPPRWNLSDVKTRRINGVLYRALPAYPVALPYTECHSTDPDAPYTSGPPRSFAITGDPRDWVGRLFLEPYRDSTIPEDAVVRLYVNVGSVDPAGVSWYGGSVSCYLQSLETLDLGGWGASTDPSGNPALLNEDLESNGIANPLGWKVGGAITDGTSICMIRHSSTDIYPPNTLLDPLVRPMQVRMTKRVDSTGTPGYLASWAGAAGTMHPADPMSLPMLPTPGDSSAQPTIELDEDSRAFYVPPDSYLDPQHTGYSESDSHNSDEECLMSIRGMLPNGQTLRGGRSFVLRRPPVVLVHGVTSNPATWDTVLWNEPSMPIPTRIYKVDYSATNTKGYSENYPILALAIDTALGEYRAANDAGHNPNVGFHGVRYAATRADVVGHSMGGQLARFYIADGMPALIDREGYVEDAHNLRSPAYTDGRWPYLHADNFGAGSIRRLITLGSPFKGSPLANAVSGLTAPGEAGQKASNGYTALVVIENEKLLPVELEDMLFPGGTAESYEEPSGVSDLETGSAVQLAMDAATYPSSHKRIPWFPVVGTAGQGIDEDPAQGLAWEAVLTLLPLVPNNPTEFDSPLNPITSDLTVAADSQRNWNGAAGHPNGVAGMDFPGTTHSPRFGLPGETTSAPISQKVGELLSGPTTPFPSSWRLGQ